MAALASSIICKLVRSMSVGIVLHEDDWSEPRMPSRPGEPTWNIALLYPRQGCWSESEYLALNTKRPIEFVRGTLEFLPWPTYTHQLILQFFLGQLHDHEPISKLPGHALVAPLPTRTVKGVLRIPDVLFIGKGRVVDFHTPPNGADLIIEVVGESAAERQHDFETKRQEYAEAAIPEYWIVDPLDRRITVLVLEGSTYHTQSESGPGASAASIVLPGFEVDVAAAFAAGDEWKKHVRVTNEPSVINTTARIASWPPNH